MQCVGTACDIHTSKKGREETGAFEGLQRVAPAKAHELKHIHEIEGDWEGECTVGYFALLESKSEQQLYEICARSRPAVKPPEVSQAASQSGPITASTMLSWIMRLIAAIARFESQSTSSQTKDTLTGNFLFASATAREMAPADARPSAQELAVGNKTAKFSTAQV